jgi:hypothetical protein
MTKETLAEQIKQLTDLTNTLLEYSKRFMKLYEDYKPTSKLDRLKYDNSGLTLNLRFIHCLMFYDALLNLNSLSQPLQNDPNKKELSIFELAELETDLNKKDKILLECKAIRNLFESNDLHKWRNKFIAHKDINSTGDPFTSYFGFAKENIINLAIDLTNQISQLINKNYNVTINNIFLDLYQKGFERLIEFFDNELKNFQYVDD